VSPSPVYLSQGSQFAALTIKTAKPKKTSRTGTPYTRTAFRLWITQAGCTTRQQVLIAEAIGGTRTGCDVAGATWRSPYDGLETADPSTFDIDHVVPLKEAWVSGASNWTPARRTAYANDLGYADSLIAVSAASNRSKADRDPAHWMPPDPAEACPYVAAWVAVKWRWNLTMDAAEKTKVDTVLAGCGGLTTPLPAKAT
jgi:hypothetical protein